MLLSLYATTVWPFVLTLGNGFKGLAECASEKSPGLRCSMEMCSEQPLWARWRQIRLGVGVAGRAICETGAQSNLFVHTPVEPDQNNWYIRTGFREQIWQPQRERREWRTVDCREVLQSKFTSWAIAQGAVWKYDKKEIAFFLQVINIIQSLSLAVSFWQQGVFCYSKFCVEIIKKKSFCRESDAFLNLNRPNML